MTTRFTRIYGLGWTMEFPPTEQDGKQVILVGPDNNPISTEQYLNARLAAALQGEVFNPQIGFALVGNTARPSKYPFNPYYGERSPRIAAAWDMFGNGTTVLRGGYGRTYGRINGVDLVLVPLLGVGQIRPVQCTATRANGTCGSSPSDPTNAFRIGTDGLKAPLSVGSPTLPQPVFPGVNEIPVSVSAALDPNFRPNVVDSFTRRIFCAGPRSHPLLGWRRILSSGNPLPSGTCRKCCIFRLGTSKWKLNRRMMKCVTT